MNKIIIFSDTHLNHQYNEKKFNFLKTLILDADRVIINGDFWEMNDITFDEFINSKWNRLLTYLKQKHTVYVFGNHDPMNKIDDRAKIFCDEIHETYYLKFPETKIVITHGHLIFRKYQKYKEGIKNFLRKFKLLRNFSKNRERFLVRLHKEKYFYREYLNSNHVIKDWKVKNLRENDYLITSHTHRPEKDLQNKFINSGMIGLGFGQYVEIITNGTDVKEINLKFERY